MKKLILTLSLALSFILTAKKTFSQSDSTLSKSYLTKQFYISEDLSGKQLWYNKILSLYPEESIPESDIDYDDLKRILALNYLIASDTINFDVYYKGIHDKISLSSDFNLIAGNWLRNMVLNGAALRLSNISIAINDSLL